MAEKSPHTMETWETTTAGGVWIYTVSDQGVEKPRRIKGKSGTRFKVKVRDREYHSDHFVDPSRDPFLNGTFKYVGAPGGKQDPPEGYQSERALSDDDLKELFKKSGNAFHAAVKKLDERNVRRLDSLATSEEGVASVSQAAFLTKYIDMEFRAGGPPTDNPDDD